MHAGLVSTVVEAPAALYNSVASGKAKPHPSHAEACRVYASSTTVPGSGSGFVAPTPVKMGADLS